MASATKNNIWLWAAVLIVALAIGFIVGRFTKKSVENFEGGRCITCNKARPCGCKSESEKERENGYCNRCKNTRPCGCSGIGSELSSRMSELGSIGTKPIVCPPCEKPDMSKWILKTSVPPCPPVPDMSRYMLKTECPPQPDMSKYVLKSSVPKCPPCISTCSKPCKIGECPPCPRPRCPTVQCPEPKACPACPAATCEPCPEPAIQCNAKYEPRAAVRPMLASTSTFGF